MRVLVISCLFLAIWPTYAVEPDKGQSAKPTVEDLKELYPPQPDGGVLFVVGDNLWQPGQHFKSGPEWLALACNATGCSLKSAALSAKGKFWQGHYDDKPTFGQTLKFSADLAVGENVVAWFQTVPAMRWLNIGNVPTYHAPQQPLKIAGKGNMSVKVDLSNGDTALLVPLLATAEYLNRLQPERGASSPIALLQLRMRNRRQLLQGNLSTCSGEVDPRQFLLWAGDLDRDGKADFLISFIDADGPVHLYLSGKAKPGNLVGLAGIYNASPFGGECDGFDGFVGFRGETTDDQ